MAIFIIFVLLYNNHNNNETALTYFSGNGQNLTRLAAYFSLRGY